MGGLRGSFLECNEGLLAVKATDEKDLENEREGFRVYFLSSIMSELRILHRWYAITLQYSSYAIVTLKSK